MVIGLDASRANQVERTGTERYAWEVIRRLPGLLPDQTIRLYLRQSPQPDLRSLGPNVEIRVLGWPPGVLWSHLRLSWELWRHRPDLLFVPANTVPIIHPWRTVTTIHDVAFERFPELYRGRSVQRRLGWLRPLIHLAVRLFTLGRYSASERDYHRWSSRHALRSSRLVLTVSDFSRREIIATLGARLDQLAVTPLGVEQDRQTAVSEKPSLGFKIPRPFILFVGRLETKKNIDGLIAAYEQYRHLTPSPHDLVLAGSPGYGWEAVAEQVKVLVSAGVAHHLGWVEPAELRLLQATASCLWFVSRYEGFGLPPLECMSFGVPVLASPVASLPEVLDSAVLFVSPDDTSGIAHAMVRLTSDQALRRQLIGRGQAWVKQFTWQKTAELTATHLRSVAGLPKAP